MPKKVNLSPENLKNWTFAMYPAAALVGSGFLLVTERKVTTETVGLIVGLLTAGTVQAVVKERPKKPDNEQKEFDHDNRGDSDNDGNSFYLFIRTILETFNWRRPYYFTFRRIVFV